MMGASADGALAAGGTVTGIIPQFMKDAEAMHKGVTDLKVVDDMHTRKRMMLLTLLTPLSPYPAVTVPSRNCLKS